MTGAKAGSPVLGAPEACALTYRGLRTWRSGSYKWSPTRDCLPARAPAQTAAKAIRDSAPSRFKCAQNMMPLFLSATYGALLPGASANAAPPEVSRVILVQTCTYTRKQRLRSYFRDALQRCCLQHDAREASGSPHQVIPSPAGSRIQSLRRIAPENRTGSANKTL